jgi:hypothetical protein
MARTFGRILPWLILLIISTTSAYGMNLAVSGTTATASRIDALAVATEECEPTSARMARYAVSNGWMPAEFSVGCR